MKKFALKTLNKMGYLATNFTAGFLWGKLMSILFSRILTEETMETKPVLFWVMFVLYVASISGFAVAWGIINPFWKLYELIDSKIDPVEDDEEWD